MKQQSIYTLGLCGLTAIILTCLPVAADTVQDTEPVPPPVVETIILPVPTPDTTPTQEPECTTDLRPFGWDKVNEAFTLEDYFPDFTLSETTMEDAPYYKLSLKNSDIYLLVDEWQQYMTVCNGTDSITVDIWYLTPSTGPHVSITVQDVTGDGQDDLVYLSSDGGFGMATAVCRIVDLTTLEVYDIEPFAQTLDKQLAVTPLDTTTDPQQLRMALTLGKSAPVYGYAYLEAGTNAEDVKVNPLTDEAGYHTIFWSSYKTHLMGSVGVTTNHSRPGQLIATVTGVLHFNPNTNSFQMGEPYFLDGELYEIPEDIGATAEEVAGLFAQALTDQVPILYQGKAQTFTQIGQVIPDQSIPQCTVADLEQDGVPEVVCARSNDWGYVILRYNDGEIYGYEEVFRGLLCLKTDGSFCGSGGANFTQFGTMTFDGTNMKMDVAFESAGLNYYQNGEEITAETFDALAAEQNAHPDVTWHDLSATDVIALYLAQS